MPLPMGRGEELEWIFFFWHRGGLDDIPHSYYLFSFFLSVPIILWHIVHKHLDYRRCFFAVPSPSRPYL